VQSFVRQGVEQWRNNKSVNEAPEMLEHEQAKVAELLAQYAKSEYISELKRIRRGGVEKVLQEAAASCTLSR